MQVSRVDIFYLHMPDYNVDIKESLRAVHDLHKQGKFTEFGLSNYSAQQVQEILDICAAESIVKPTVYQGMYNALTRGAEALFPLLHKNDIRFYAYNPLAGGFLSGKFLKYEDQPLEGTRFADQSLGGTVSRSRYWKQEYFDGLDLIKAAAAQYAPNMSLAEIALVWMHHHSAMRREHFDGIIIGQTSFEHLDINLKSGTGSDAGLPAELVAAIDTAWALVKDVAPSYFRAPI